MGQKESTKEILKEYRKPLYDALEEWEKQEKEENEVVSTKKSKNGMDILFVQKEEKTYRLNSLYNPQMEAEKWAQQFTTKSLHPIFILFGFGNGILVRTLLQRAGEEGLVLVYEPSMAIFAHVLAQEEIADLLQNPRLGIYVAHGLEVQFQNTLANYIAWENLKTREICTHPQYEKVFPKEYEKFEAMLEDHMVRVLVNKNTEEAIGSLTIKNTIRNIRQIPNNAVIGELKGKISEDIPVFIVSAGPSLDKNIKELKQIKQRGIIFAVDTAVKYLLREEIMPDFIVTLDPRKSTEHLKDERCKTIPVFCKMEAKPEFVEQNNGHIIFFSLAGYEQKLYERLDIEVDRYRAGGSVATGACSICMTLGFKTIILVGQDLAYGEGRSTHAGSVYKTSAALEKDTKFVEGIHGGLVEARYDWYVYLKWFEDAIEIYKEKGTVIDATEGGAKIEGAVNMTLHEAIETYCKKPIDLKKIVTTLSGGVGKKEKFQMILQEDFQDLIKMKQECNEALALSIKLQKACKGYQGKSNQVLKWSKKLHKLNQKLEQKPVYLLIDMDMAADTLDTMGDVYLQEEDEQENERKTYQQLQMIYEAMLRSIDRILPQMEEIIS